MVWFTRTSVWIFFDSVEKKSLKNLIFPICWACWKGLKGKKISFCLIININDCLVYILVSSVDNYNARDYTEPRWIERPQSGKESNFANFCFKEVKVKYSPNAYYSPLSFFFYSRHQDSKKKKTKAVNSQILPK